MPNLQDKCRGMLVGLAVGDALGANIEFSPDNHSDILKNKKIEMTSGMYPKGAWTDDTSMALCLADSLLDRGGYDSYDVMQKYSDWMNKGRRSFDGQPAGDVGNQIRGAINGFDSGESRIIWKEYDRGSSAGNGALMRLAPVVIAGFGPDKKVPTLKDGGVILYSESNADDEFFKAETVTDLLKLARASARETHYSLEAEYSAEYFAAMLYIALKSGNKYKVEAYAERLLQDDEQEFIFGHKDKTFIRYIEKSGDSLKDLGGYCLDALTIAVWGLLRYEDFESGMRAVIRLGGDTDTNGAIYGQLAGAFYGYEAIPERWRKGLLQEKAIRDLADQLYKKQPGKIIRTRFEEDEAYFENPK
jgi:ADP-ribosyl-[dinitrogen reductase] hydrolase